MIKSEYREHHGNDNIEEAMSNDNPRCGNCDDRITPDNPLVNVDNDKYGLKQVCSQCKKLIEGE